MCFYEVQNEHFDCLSRAKGSTVIDCLGIPSSMPKTLVRISGLDNGWIFQALCVIRLTVLRAAMPLKFSHGLQNEPISKEMSIPSNGVVFFLTDQISNW